VCPAQVLDPGTLGADNAHAMDGPHARRPSATRLDRPVTALLFTLSLAPILLGAGAWIALGPADPSRPAALAAVALASAGWWTALAVAPRVTDSLATAVVIASGALALRVGFLGSDLALSDDVNRYVWEGALVAEGGDPYRYAPAAPELAAARERWGELAAAVNHPDVPAAYPPLAQGLHAGVVALAGGAERPARARFLLRLLYGGADLLLCLPLAALLIRRGRPLACTVAWAWNPWVAQEFAGAAHLDSLALLLSISALACGPARGRLGSARAVSAAVLLAAGALVKLFPAAFLPFLLRRLPRPAWPVLAFVLALGLGTLPFFLLTGAIPRASGLGTYAFRWESASLVYRWIEPCFVHFFPYDETWSDPRRLARVAVAGAWLALGAWAWRRRLDPVRAAGVLCAGFVVLTPTLHPWYLAWSVPFLAFTPALWLAALAGLAPLLYWPLARGRAEGVWSEPAWLHPLLVGLLLALSLLELAHARRSR
jgi:hypothetical protein